MTYSVRGDHHGRRCAPILTENGERQILRLVQLAQELDDAAKSIGERLGINHHAAREEFLAVRQFHGTASQAMPGQVLRNVAAESAPPLAEIVMGQHHQTCRFSRPS
jgi:hypothetical protein